MDGVKIRVEKRPSSNNANTVNKRRLQKSTTLNRRFVKKPSPVPRINASAAAASRALKTQNKKQLITKTKSVQLEPIADAMTTKRTQASMDQDSMRERLASRSVAGVASLKELALAPLPVEDDEPIEIPKENRIAKAANARMAARRKAPVQQKQRMSAHELKEQAIQRAMRKVATMESTETESNLGPKKHFWQRKHFALAASMAAIALILIAYLVGVNMPDISVRVAAIQTGIERIYPSYVPSTFRIDGLVKEENGRVTISFKNDRNQKFQLVEEKSSWDSSAVLSNYVQKNWGTNYTITRGQGLTIYISDSKAAWVNGGVLYVITAENEVLSSADLHDIAVSF